MNMKHSLLGTSLLLCYSMLPSSIHASMDEEEPRQRMKRPTRPRPRPARDAGTASEPVPVHASAYLQQLQANRHKPRHLFVGILMAAKTLLIGGLAAGTASLGAPIASIWVLVSHRAAGNRLTGGRGGYVLPAISGLCVGGVVGGVSAVSINVYAVIRAVTLLYDGVVATPGYLAAWLIQRRVWDPYERKWRDRSLSLEDERQELLRSMEEQEAAAARQRRDVEIVDTALYDVLDVSADASKAAIKRAYFAKARDIHPDKNRDDPRAHDNFVELHDAYSTLSDDTKRYDYDRWGSSRGHGNGGDTVGASRILPKGFDANLFVAVLFSGEGGLSSPTVERFVGDLGLANFIDKGYKCLYLIESVSIMRNQQQTDAKIAQFAKELMGEEDAHELRRSQRTLEIATHLARRARSLAAHYAEAADGDADAGAAPEERFRAEVRDEARRLLDESRFYGATYLEIIGSSLLQSRVPAAAAYRKWATRKAFLRASYDFFARLKPRAGARADAHNIDVAALLPAALRLIDLVNRADVSAAMQGAIWKVLHDPGASRRDLRHRRRAIHLIGQEFTQLAAGSDERAADELATNFELAFKIASKKG